MLFVYTWANWWLPKLLLCIRDIPNGFPDTNTNGVKTPLILFCNFSICVVCCCAQDAIQAEKALLKNYYEEIWDKSLLTSLCFYVECDRDER